MTQPSFMDWVNSRGKDLLGAHQLQIFPFASCKWLAGLSSIPNCKSEKTLSFCAKSKIKNELKTPKVSGLFSLMASAWKKIRFSNYVFPLQQVCWPASATKRPTSETMLQKLT